MKTRKKSNTIPNYNLAEELINAISHGIGAGLSIAGLILLIIKANTPLKIITSIIFGITMIILYTISCIYHSLSPKLKGKKLVYSSGTVMHLEHQGQNYILTAFSRMRPNGNSSMSRITYTDFLSSLWKKLAVINVQDETLNITVFGASSISGLPADFSYQDKLHEIVKSFLLASKNQRLCKKLRICMTTDDYRQLDYEDIKSLAAYFDSHLSQLDLKPSHTEWRRGVSFKPLLKGVL